MFPDRLDQLTQSNICPSNAESIQFKKLVHTEKLIIEDLNFELEQAQATVQRLTSIILAHSGTLKQYQRALAPIRRVPEELIHEIFLHVQAPDKDFPDPQARGRPDALTLTQTCSSWRRIAIGCPQLWKCLSLSLFSQGPFKTVDLAREWLVRAKNLPLSLQLKCTPVVPVSSSIPEELVAVAKEYFPQCRILSLALSESTAEIYRRMGQKFVPRLEYLDIDFDIDNSRAFPPIRLSALSFDIAPCLRAVSILSTATGDPFNLNTVVLPWEQLTHLELGFIHFPSGGTKTLERCINLQECILHISHIRNHWDTASPSVIFLPKLRSLRLNTKDLEALKRAFRIFTVPALEALEVVSPNHCFRGEFPLSDFMDFQRRSAFSLKGFIVIKMTLKSDDIFRIMPSLRALALNDCLEDGPLLKASCRSSLEETQKILCIPMLENLLVIDGSGHRAFRDCMDGMNHQSGSSSHPSRWWESFSPRFMRDWDFRNGLSGRGLRCDSAESRWM